MGRLAPTVGFEEDVTLSEGGTETVGCAFGKTAWPVEAFASGSSVGGAAFSEEATSGSGGPCSQAYSLDRLAVGADITVAAAAVAADFAASSSPQIR